MGRSSTFALLSALAAFNGVLADNSNWVSPVYSAFFSQPMPIPPVKQPK
jgi:hypothetical protein